MAICSRITGQVKEELAYPARAAAEDKSARIPDDRTLTAAFRAIRKETTAAGNIRDDSGSDASTEPHEDFDLTRPVTDPYDGETLTNKIKIVSSNGDSDTAGNSGSAYASIDFSTPVFKVDDLYYPELQVKMNCIAFGGGSSTDRSIFGSYDSIQDPTGCARRTAVMTSRLRRTG